MQGLRTRLDNLVDDEPVMPLLLSPTANVAAVPLPFCPSC